MAIGQAKGGYVYFLTNPSMPGMIKIGKTTRHPEKRTAELTSATGVPTPFKLEGFIPTPNPTRTEAEIHRRLSGKRVNSKREFFNSSVQEAILIAKEVAQQERLRFSRKETATVGNSILAIICVVAWFNGLMFLLGLNNNPTVAWLIVNIALMILMPNTFWKLVSTIISRNTFVSLILLAGSLAIVKVMYPSSLLLSGLFAVM